VARRDPEIVVASWCGKPVRQEKIASRVGWQEVTAVREHRIHEIKSAYILQPGPAALTEGVRQLHAIITNCSRA
jgi:iron complex transport system substrate-binding protein